MIWIMIVGVNGMEIWGDFGLLRLGVEGGSVSTARKIIFRGGGVIVGS